jgi:hypothetical protein
MLSAPRSPSRYDFRNNTSAPGALTDYWIAYCHSACTDGDNWGDENSLTNASFDIEQAPFARGPFGFFVGDYQGLSSVATDFAALRGAARERSGQRLLPARRLGRSNSRAGPRPRPRWPVRGLT